MTKELIAVDVDEVLFPFVKHFVEYDDALHGSGLTEEDFHSYRFEDVLGISVEESHPRVYDFNGADHSHVSPIDQARDSLDRLAEDFNFAIVTARHPNFEKNTMDWLDRHFENMFSSVTHIGYDLAMEMPQTKAEICKELGAVALIDDSTSHVAQCVAEGMDGILFGDYAWNQDEAFSEGKLPQGVIRCENWPAVLEYFDARD